MTESPLSKRENELASERLLLSLAALWYSELTPGVLPGGARAVIFEHVLEEEVSQLAREFFAANPAPALAVNSPAKVATYLTPLIVVLLDLLDDHIAAGKSG